VITVGGFNSALDKSMDTRELVLGEVNRVHDVRTELGGKGLHVAVTVAALGEPVQLVGLVDAQHRSLFESFLAARGVVFHGLEIPGPLRTNLAIRDQEGTRVTELLEPGPEVTRTEQEALCALFLDLARESTLAVLSGSLPPGFGASTYARLVTALRESAVRCLVDASGELLREAVSAKPFLVKPNRDEGEALTGRPIDGPVSAAAAARGLVEAGIDVVVQSLGAEGAVAVTPQAAFHARVVPARVENPVGSGDCLLGGVAVALARGATLEELARAGVACGAANAETAETGVLRRADVERLLPQVVVRAL
jgi:tagatose 6-phosphate kinase